MNGSRRTFSILYLVSSASALSMEIVWARWLATQLGSTVLATACVLGAFMGGLGAGAWVAGTWAPNLRRPLRTFAWIQLIGGLLSFLPFGVGHLPPGSWFAVGLIAVAMASFPLGMVFPIAVRVRQTDGSAAGAATGRLYALDTAGALLGCLLTGWWAIASVGLWRCLVVAAAAKLLVAAVGAGLCKNPRVDPHEYGPVSQKPRSTRGLLWLVAVQGFCLLGAETLWSRMLAFVLFRGSTTYALCAMLAVVLGATSAGALCAQRLCRSNWSGWTLAFRGAVWSGFSLLLSLAVLLTVGPVPSASPVGPIDLLITLAACAPASFFSGWVFAAACQALGGPGVSRAAGHLLGANTLAAVGGALLVPLGMVPLLGMSVSLVLIGFAPVVVGWMVSLGSKKRVGWWAPALALVVVAGLPLAGPRWIRHLGDPLFYLEGPDVSVAVIEESPGNRRLYVDGIAVAGTDRIMATDQKTLAHFPLLLHPDPGRVLTIGFGSGGTSHSLLLHPGIEVDCVEISPSVLRAAPYLAAANHGVLERQDPRYHLVVQDAKRFLLETESRYDVIVSDCTDLAYRSDASLYSRETFSLIRNRLDPGGIAAAWIPLRGQAPFRVLGSVIRSFGTVFPRMSLWVFDATPTHFGILVGSDQDLVLHPSRIRERLMEPGVFTDLAEIELADPARLVASLQADDEMLRSFSVTSALHTDDHPVVEFLAPGETGDDASAYCFLQALGNRVTTAQVEGSDEDRNQVAERVLVRPWLMAGHRAFMEGDESRARALYIRALRLNRFDPVPRSLLGLHGLELAVAARRGGPLEVGDALTLAAVFLLEGRPERALFVLGPLLERNPLDPGLNLAAGFALLEQGANRLAAMAFDRVRQAGTTGPLSQGACLGLILANLPGSVSRIIQVLTFAGL
jgi:spermidine synthase